MIRASLLALFTLLLAAPAAEAAPLFTYSGTELTITDGNDPSSVRLNTEDSDWLCAGHTRPCMTIYGDSFTEAAGRCTIAFISVCDLPTRVTARLGGGSDRLDLASLAAPAEIHGGSGDDELEAGAGIAFVYGEAGSDQLVGGPSGGTLDGGDGDDGISGGAASESISGGPGDDEMNGGPGNDTLDGGDGNDQFEVSWGDSRSYGEDEIIGGAGWDHVMYWGRGGAVSVTADGLANDGEGGEGDNVHGDVEFLYGSDHDDTLIGSDGVNVILGEGGDDTIDGRGGDDELKGDGYLKFGRDTLSGGAGNDKLEGQSDDDVLDGGPGVDELLADIPCTDNLDGTWNCPGHYPGNDTVLARDGEADTVRCGRGGDTVTADAIDNLTDLPIGFKDQCESVDRGGAPAGPAPGTPAPGTPAPGPPLADIKITGTVTSTLGGRAVSVTNGLPAGATVDTRKGTLTVGGARISGGLFKVTRAGAGALTLALATPSGAAAKCARNRRAIVRTLTVTGSSTILTTGGAATATAAGGKPASWTISDRCDGTTVKAAAGSVCVAHTKGKRKTTTLKAKRSVHVQATLFR